MGNIKPRNTWLHTVNWDLVVFDEYHFGAWRDTAKELFEGEDDAVAKKETKLEYPGGGAFLAMVTDPEYRELVKHRQAAVEDSRLIRMAPVADPGEGFGE